MIMSTVALIKEKPKATDAEIHSMLNSHICRCCGYPSIVKAVKRAVAQA
jgi:aerobic-type carbon monoxide dehydrogenase small subunit (CoxS/CutS family)